MAAMPGQPPMMPGPMGAPMGESGDDQAPAAAVLPIIAMLAQQQSAVMEQESRREDAIKEMMKQQLLRVISMIPVANPAGMAARTEPMPPQMPPGGVEPGITPVGNEEADSEVMM
jgi:hypothetical protein